MIGYLLDQELRQRARRPAGGHAAHAGDRRPSTTRRSRTRPSRSARSTTARPPSGSPPSAAGRSRPTGRTTAASSPRPSRARSSSCETLRLLVEAGVLVVCVGGGGIPVAVDRDGRLRGVEAVIDKDLAAALLARGPRRRRAAAADRRAGGAGGLGHAAGARPRATPRRASCARSSFADGSMGPKVEAACRFAEATGGLAGHRRARRRARDPRRPPRHARRRRRALHAPSSMRCGRDADRAPCHSARLSDARACRARSRRGRHDALRGLAAERGATSRCADTGARQRVDRLLRGRARLDVGRRLGHALARGDEAEVMVEPLQHAAGGDPADAAGRWSGRGRRIAWTPWRTIARSAWTQRGVLRDGDDAGAHELAHRRVQAAVGEPSAAASGEAEMEVCDGMGRPYARAARGPSAGRRSRAAGNHGGAAARGKPAAACTAARMAAAR